MTECYRKYFSESRNATKASTCKNYCCRSSFTLRYFSRVSKNTDEFVFNSLKDFRGVGRFYEDFQQVEDDEVIQMLKTTHPPA
jgi:hypothetical protein